MLEKMPRRQTLVESVVERLKDYILTSGVKPGERIPSQDELAVRLGVSRNVIREAIKGLEMVGIIRSRHGGGVYVASFDARPLADSIAFRLHDMEPRLRLEYIYEARERFEVGSVDLIVTRMTDADHARLQQTLTLMQEQPSGGESRSLELDFVFHRSILEASHNPVIYCFGEILHELFLLLRQMPDAPQQATDIRNVARSHQLLYQAITSQDPVKAQAAMREHIAVSKKHWLPGRP